MANRNYSKAATDARNQASADLARLNQLLDDFEAADPAAAGERAAKRDAAHERAKKAQRERAEAAILERMRREYPGASWSYIWAGAGTRILVSIPKE